MYLLINYRIWALAIILLISCNQEKGWDCVKTRGETITEIRVLEDFNRIFLFDKIKYNLIQDSLNFLVINSGRNVISNIKSEINNSQLNISLKHNCELFRKSDEVPIVDIHFKSIKNLQIFNSQDVISPTVTSRSIITLDELLISKRSNGKLVLLINANHIFIYSNEYGDTELLGIIKSVSTVQEGVGKIDLKNANIEKANITINGPGETLIRCEKVLSANLNGSGNLTIFGAPDSTAITSSGTGSVLYLP